MLSSRRGWILSLQLHPQMLSLNSGVMKRVWIRLLMQQVAPTFAKPLQLIQIIMKSKLPKKKEVARPLEEEQQEQEPLQNEEEELEEQEELSLIPRMLRKEALFVTFTGTIERGVFQEDESLTAFCSIVHGVDWTRLNGEKNFISQVAASDGQEIVWNLPFEISFETTTLAGWPQLVLALYGTDFFGRSFVRGYGNIHLPAQTGTHKRTLRVFKPLPQSTISGIFGFIGGVQAQYKDHEKLLASGDGRQVTRVKSMGEVRVRVNTVKYNFANYGYE